MDFLETGVSILTGILPSAIKAVSIYYQSKKKDENNINTIQSLQGKEETEKIEDYLLSSIEKILIESNFISKEIDQNYDDLREFPFFAKYIYSINQMDTIIKNRIGEIITNYHFENITHCNILFLGVSNNNKNSLISSIVDLYDLKEESPIKSEENEKCVSYTKKDLRLLNYIEKEINIENIKQLIEEESYNNNQNNFIHCIWYLLKGEQIEKKEKENIAKLIEYFDDILPIIVIFKQNFYSSDDIEAKEEIANQINEKFIKTKKINIFELESDNDSTLVLQKNNDNIKSNMKISAKELVNFSKSIIELSLRSPRFYSYILKNIYKNENNKIFSEIKKIIEERVNCFLPGNKIQNMHLLNKQIIRIIIKKLYNIEKIDATGKQLVYNLFQRLENFILTKSKDYFDKAFGNCDYYELFNFIQNLGNKDNRDDIDVDNEIAKFTKKKSSDKKNDKKNKISKENEELEDKIKTLFIDIIVKRSSYYLDCKIAEELIKILNESFSSKINDFNEDIRNKLNLNS